MTVQGKLHHVLQYLITFYTTSLNFDVVNMIIALLVEKDLRERIMLSVMYVI